MVTTAVPANVFWCMSFESVTANKKKMAVRMSEIKWKHSLVFVRTTPVLAKRLSTANSKRNCWLECNDNGSNDMQLPFQWVDRNVMIIITVTVVVLALAADGNSCMMSGRWWKVSESYFLLLAHDACMHACMCPCAICCFHCCMLLFCFLIFCNKSSKTLTSLFLDAPKKHFHFQSQMVHSFLNVAFAKRLLQIGCTMLQNFWHFQ